MTAQMGGKPVSLFAWLVFAAGLWSQPVTPSASTVTHETYEQIRAHLRSIPEGETNREADGRGEQSENIGGTVKTLKLPELKIDTVILIKWVWAFIIFGGIVMVRQVRIGREKKMVTEEPLLAIRSNMEVRQGYHFDRNKFPRKDRKRY